MPQHRIHRYPLRDHLRLARPELADHALTAVNPIAANTKTPLRADARRNREPIIASARELFALRGEQAHMGDIAKHAGVGKGTLYRHFPDKKLSLIEVIRARFEELCEIASRAEDIEDPFESVEAALRTTLVAIEGDTGLQFELMRCRRSALGRHRGTEGRVRSDHQDRQTRSNSRCRPHGPQL